MKDKLVQSAAAKILDCIYEQDFIKESYGYRLKVGAHTAIISISDELHFGKYSYIVEADIKGFFNNISHEWLTKMLNIRIDDKAFVNLISKWPRAGILEVDGQIIHPATGTPQGGIISPVLAPDIINIISFSRFRKYENTYFEFLGFEYRWGVSARGKDIIKKATSRKKLRQSILNFKNWCRENKDNRIKKIVDMLNIKLRGYYNYYGVIGNSKSLWRFYNINM